MKIEELFAKSISRNLEGVIKVGEDTAPQIEQELDEYVVTEELQKHFKTFFERYDRSFRQPTTEIGVWISGFFGSGKSHLLKILAYLLENVQAGDRRAIDFFTEGKKIKDPQTLAAMQHVAAQAPDSDVIAFNIDAKNQQDNQGNKELLRVFVNVFNEMRGYSPSEPALASLEAFLDKKGKYAAFQQAFMELTGTDWKEERNDFLFVSENIKDALVEAGIYEAKEADRIVESLTDTYSISIEQFAKSVREYCQQKGPQHRVIFLVDEIGQYIGDNSTLMLNLQTLTENLSYANGQVWILVTSQQNIDEVVKVSGDDFSKIQGRFDTRLSLSSANVDEVLKRRILAKTEKAAAQLQQVYAAEETNLKNILRFTADTPFQRLYEDAQDFSDTYPFVPYQFDLLQNTLTDIRKNSASGKSIASGERSMLAVFKESAQAMKEQNVGLLIPYDAFYNPIAEFIDHIHRQVIIKAEKNPRLTAFDLRVLKVLFLVKYVRTFKANLDNLTTLLIDDLHTDRLELREKVLQSLNRLVSEVLVQKNLDEYTFLTDQEQDINRSIRNVSVDNDEIIQYLAREIFGGILKSSAYKYTNRYTFHYDQYVDNRLIGSGRHNPISINILTPYALTDTHLPYTEQTLAAQGMREEKQLLVKLPANATFWDEISKVIQIGKYIQKAPVTNTTVAGIINVKSQERIELSQHITAGLQEALGQAAVYVRGDLKDIRSKAPIERIRTGLKYLIETLYNKLETMGGYEPAESDIQQILQMPVWGNLFPNDQEEYNLTAAAQEEIFRFLGLRLAQKQTVVLSQVLERFADIPYGFDHRDTLYCLALLYKKGKITLTLNSEMLSPGESDAATVYRYLTERLYRDKLVLAQRIAVDKRKIDTAIRLRQECFGHVTTSREEDDIMEEIKTDLRREVAYIQDNILPHFASQNRYHDFYQGKELAEDLQNLFQTAVNTKGAVRFFTYLENKEDDILDIYDDLYPDVRAFFDPQQPEQLHLFNQACDIWQRYRQGSSLITDVNVKNLAQRLYKILTMKNPFGRIKDLNQLMQQLSQAYRLMLEEERGQLLPRLEEARDTVLKAMDSTVFEDQDAFHQRAVTAFDDLKKELFQAQTMAEISNVRSVNINKKDWFIKQIQEKSDAYAEKKRQEEAEKQTSEPKSSSGLVKEQADSPKNTQAPLLMAMRSLKPQTTVIRNEEDMDVFLAEIRKKLAKKLKEGRIITIIE